jgi:hypothetical protein
MQPAILRPDETTEYFSEERCHILELANSPADGAASVARARVTPGSTTAWHRVRGTVERYVILEGTGPSGSALPTRVAHSSSFSVSVPRGLNGATTNAWNNNGRELGSCNMKSRTSMVPRPAKCLPW